MTVSLTVVPVSAQVEIVEVEVSAGVKLYQRLRATLRWQTTLLGSPTVVAPAASTAGVK